MYLPHNTLCAALTKKKKKKKRVYVVGLFEEKLHAGAKAAGSSVGEGVPNRQTHPLVRTWNN